MVLFRRLKILGPAWVGLLFVLVVTSWAQNNEVLGEIQFLGPSKAEKTSGVWVDGQYVGYLDELKGDKKVLLLPGDHEIAVRQAGYRDFVQKVTVEPGRKLVLRVMMLRDPKAEYSSESSQLKIVVTPSRAAVFVDDAFLGHAQELGGVGRKLLVSPGKHRIKVALPGYQTFETEVNLLPRQKARITTDLVKGSITEAGPLIKKQ